MYYLKTLDGFGDLAHPNYSYRETIVSFQTAKSNPTSFNT